MNEFDHAPIDDLDVEITDLDPIEEASRISKVLMAWEERPSLHKQCWRIVTACGTFLLILLVLFGTFSSLRGLTFSFFSRLSPAHSTTSITTIATPVDSYVFNPNDEIVWTLGDSSPFIPSASLGPAPRDCPAISQTQPVAYKGAPQAAGSFPVLVLGFGGPDAVLTNFTHAQPPEIGWYKHIVLLSQTNYAGTVTFRGGEIHDGTPIWFGMKQHNQGPITTFTMLPLKSSVSNHTGSDEEWGLSTATLYIPRAGCYFLTATWPKGGWIVFFSAGG